METQTEAQTQEVVKTRTYQAGEFEGPLDLLWTLIRESKVNIYDIPISQITEQYLDYLDNLKETDLQDLSEFYSWAAKLVLIKSRMLLPVEIEYDDEDMEDPRQELVERLIEYQKFKKLSELMEEKEDESEWSFERKKIHRILPVEDEESQWERIDTYEKILNMYEEISVNEKITLMNEYLENQGECMFTDLITRVGNEMDLICAFMAILEAVKFKMATIYQSKFFGDIKICKFEAA